ncbi:hypothetical protein [Variovorax sp. PAMC26660]|uniref:hypothetical protein n=1 Tax=Variovorax sp. PAMC26660 TaxID=2762322 RepID=UPI00164EAB09|nr:hypothetical protein [Variovorax sp. PAMC26660]QNK66863.1 hypothetical protein H7F35_27390 [Variovorax sp. PAMC26660]
MAQHLTPRVIRAYSLPVEQFDHLKNYQRSLQFAADAEAGTPACEGDAHWITNSQTLAHILHHHGLLATVAVRSDMHIGPFVSALYMGDLVAGQPEVQS